MDDEDQAAMDAGWAQAQESEHRRQEDEALARHRVLTRASRAELEEFIRDSNAFHKRIQQEFYRAKSQ